jgi:tetratricopeptide (TPR) repeat protein
MIPTKSGEFELPAVKFLYFDPKKKSYEAAEVKPPKIVVSKQTSGLALPASPVSPATSSSAPTKKAGQAPLGKVAQPLAYGEPGLPREPIEGSGFGIAPVGQAWWVGLGILPWGILLALWWRWARQRALFTDEERLRKESLQSWKSAVEMVREAGQDMRSSEKALLFWQKSVAGTLGIEGATPAWGVIADGIQPMEKSDQETLEKCWVDSENGLYGRNPSLDGEWCDQAERLAGRIDLPAIKVWAPLKPKNLFPWITALLFLFVAVEPLSAQGINKEQAKEEKTKKEDPIQLYKTGNFSEAEKVWREKVLANPRDPVARNNLALAYFQLGDKERALAYGLSAYLISPATASVSWNTRIFAQSSDQLDRAVMGLWSERSREWITGRLGVFGWQLAFVLGVTILAVGCGFGLGSGYFSQKRTLFVRVGIATFAIGLMLFMAASTALGIYGKLADRNAVMIVDVEPLRSIPTEAEAQAEKAYPPGSIARLEKSFLGWSKIRLPNQDAGWIRSEHIVSLY